MKSAPSAPAAPDPQASANAQTGSNIQTAIANARLNRVNQSTPFGSISYTQGPPDANGVPTYSSNITLSPQQQAILDAQQQQTQQRQQLAGQFLGNVSTKPLDLSHLGNLYDRYGDFNQAPPQARSPQYSQPNPNTGMSNADMMAALQQYLQSQGGMPTGGQTSIAQALRNAPAQSTAPTPDVPATQAPGVVPGDPNGASPFGTDGPTYKVPGSNTGDSWEPDTYKDQYVNVGGKQMLRVGHLPQGSTDYFKDPSKVQYDPQYGFVTTPDNLTGGSPDTTMGKIIPAGIALGAGAVVAPYLAAQLGGAAGSSAAPAMDESAGLNMSNPFASGGAPVSDASVTASQGAPVSDLSVQAAQPNPFQQAYQNWSAGKGIFGNRIAGAATGPLLGRILRGMTAQGGK